MTDRGYNNFYTPDEYESYQQFHRTPTHEEIFLTQQLEELSKQISNLISLQEESIKAKQVAYCELCNGDHPTGHCPPMTDVQFDQMIKQMANKQSMEVQTNTQTNPDEKDSILPEEYGESVEEDIEKNEEERIVERGGVVKKVKEMDTPHEVELPQEIPCIEKVNTVDSEKEVMDTNENDGLFDKEESYELKKEIENKAEIDRVIDEIRALFNKKELGRIWTPQYLYLKFMEFLPNQRKKTDDVISVSFWPP
ncbi:hypothetical protein QL285_073796 [Trifolium repens]|nr:hypothetical protein QL285_073795 [Trifolium repens]KAK2372683.1 hypothetical protein QL285_073796 [Trifolium repens]